jgi:hypothetical protein
MAGAVPLLVEVPTEAAASEEVVSSLLLLLFPWEKRKWTCLFGECAIAGLLGALRLVNSLLELLKFVGRLRLRTLSA